jgi:hypothetical protein
MDDKNIREILIGKTFDEKVVLFAPISIGCLFIWEIPSLITDACFRYLIISLIIYRKNAVKLRPSGRGYKAFFRCVVKWEP